MTITRCLIDEVHTNAFMVLTDAPESDGSGVVAVAIGTAYMAIDHMTGDRL